MIMKIAIGTDHRGYALKEQIKQHLHIADHAIIWNDCGAFHADRSDYPIFASLVCQTILTQQAERGVLLCGSGIGMSIAANRFADIYAGLVWNADLARLSRTDDNCNVLVIAADFCDEKLALALMQWYLKSSSTNYTMAIYMACARSMLQKLLICHVNGSTLIKHKHSSHNCKITLPMHGIS